MRLVTLLATVFVILVLVLGSTPAAFAQSCVVPDDGTGTVNLPPMSCSYHSPDDVWLIVDGLPAGATIEFDTDIADYVCDTSGGYCSGTLPPGFCEGAGGGLGGSFECFTLSLDMPAVGTGDLAGFNRHLVVNAEAEIHNAPRTPGDPVQVFAGDWYLLAGELFGDPDFCVFRVRGGTSLGLPSPGQTTLTELPTGDFQVDSFFDVTYQIEFAGCPGGALDGLMGTTTATVRVDTSGPPMACCMPDHSCAELVEGACIASGGIPQGAGSVCAGTDCGELCCPAPDDGTGTAELPTECPYSNAVQPMMVVNGLPPGTTLEMLAVLGDRVCAGSGGFCSESLGTGICEAPGGGLGGTFQCFDATLALQVTGTGDLTGFSRSLWVPTQVELHAGSRVAGDPIQDFPADIYLLDGELFGDPDFCMLRVRAGTSLGLPSPGQTTLTELDNGDYAVDSFFDVVYEIEFAGCPGSPLEDLSGTTTDSLTLYTCGALFADGFESGDFTAWALSVP